MADTKESLTDIVALTCVFGERIGGLWLRSRHGPARDAVLAALPPRLRRIHPGLDDIALMGGIDVAATLASQHAVRTQGILESDGLAQLTMAERCPPGLAGRLCARLDRGAFGIIACDEGDEDEMRLPAALADRLALRLDLEGQPAPKLEKIDPLSIAAARDRFHHIALRPKDMTTLTEIALQLGVDSLRRVILAGRVARCLAALQEENELTDTHIEKAAILTLAHCATQLPTQSAETPPPEPELPEPEPPVNEDDAATEDPPPQDTDAGTESITIPQDLILEAVKAAIPPDILAQLNDGKAQRNQAQPSAGAGAKRQSQGRGRPLPARPGRPDGRRMIDVVATLRAAAPWQRMRPKRPGHSLAIWPSDLHLRRTQDRAERLVIFAVDASGSAAMSRLAEAKGAVELLLAQAYSSRDHIALITFRGDQAELSLPPTRALVQAKRRLSAVPGGGGTPLAAAIDLIGETAASGRHKGMTPAMVLLTDGRANIARDGSPGRARAAQDAKHSASMLREAALNALVLDTGRRPHAPLAELAQILGAQYVPLPRTNAQDISELVQKTLGPTN